MVQLSCLIKIGHLTFRRTSGVEIQSSWKTIGDTATVKLFGFVRVEDPDDLTDADFSSGIRKVEDIVRVGDKVEIKLGYDDQLRTEFIGYVAELKLTVPFEVRCEDAFYHLKRTPVNRSWKTTTLSALLHELAGLAKIRIRVSSKIPKVTLTNFRAPHSTVYEVLSKLKETCQVCAYFRAGTLFVGLPYTEFTSYSRVKGSEARYSWQQNVVSDDLSFKRKEDVRLKVTVTAKHTRGKATTVTVGDPDGQEYNIKIPSETTNQAELRKMAQKRLNQLKYDGYRGTLTSFGVPYVVHSGVADLLDSRYPQRAGRYLVDEVKTSFGTGGFRRTITLGQRVKANAKTTDSGG